MQNAVVSILLSVIWSRYFLCQTFHTRSFDDEEFDVGVGSEKHAHGDDMSSHVIDVDDDGQFVDSPVEEEQMENIATLFMSCSPGRDTEEEEEEDEDEDDSVPLSRFYGVSSVIIKMHSNIIERTSFYKNALKG